MKMSLIATYLRVVRHGGNLIGLENKLFAGFSLKRTGSGFGSLQER